MLFLYKSTHIGLYVPYTAPPKSVFASTKYKYIIYKYLHFTPMYFIHIFEFLHDHIIRTCTYDIFVLVEHLVWLTHASHKPTYFLSLSLFLLPAFNSGHKQGISVTSKADISKMPSTQFRDLRGYSVILVCVHSFKEFFTCGVEVKHDKFNWYYRLLNQQARIASNSCEWVEIHEFTNCMWFDDRANT